MKKKTDSFLNNVAIDCDSRFPIMLVHGTSMADCRNTRCWGRIPKMLTTRGAKVCFGRQDAWGSTPNNAKQLAKSLDEALAKFGADKINIIAHSKGGLDARLLATDPNYRDKIATITTVSTPHHGIGWLSKGWWFLSPWIFLATVLFYPFIRLFFGDKKPNPYLLAKIMTRKGCERFNLETPDQPDIFYQSFAGKMLPENRNIEFFFTRLAANRIDGDNDGLIAVESAKWGLFRGIFIGTGKHGLSHSDEVDLFKRTYEGNASLFFEEKTYSNVPEIYAYIVSDLKTRGF